MADRRIDERTIMFSRAELKPGTERFDRYYRDHPEHLDRDNRFRSHPGLLKQGSLYYHPLIFSASEATFRTVSALHQMVDGEVDANRLETDPAIVTGFILNWCRSMGAHSAGITELRDEHLYSIGGRHHNYGEEVRNRHKFAIAFTVEMDYNRVKMAPKGPITMESSAQYLHAGTIAVNVAGFIRELGYPARAHIDGNYQLRCPQVARDAGLGELGRMSLLMTPWLGPRVRIGVVTTDLPLIQTPQAADPTVGEFCRHCNKCAENCPANAISFSDPEPGKDWSINQEACYTYWCKSGTDCGRCLAVCPYSHRDNLFHNIIRSLVRRSLFFRRIAVPLDNWFYGREPSIRDMDDWMEK